VSAGSKRWLTAALVVVSAVAARSDAVLARGEHSAASSHARLVDVRRFAAQVPGELVDISRDGRLIAYVAYLNSERYRAGVVDLGAGRIRELAVGSRDGFANVRLSPDGRWLALTRGRHVLVVDTDTGNVRRIGRIAADGLGWLDDGRLTFLGRDGMLKAFGVDARRNVLVRRLPSGTRFAPAVSPDGRYVLYAHACSTWLLDRHDGKRRRIGRTRDGLGIAPGAWSPDSRHYFVHEGEWFAHCTRFQDTSSRTTRIRDIGGHSIGTVSGEPSWSSDGSLVLAYDGVTGTAVSYLQPLEVFNLRTKKVTTLLPGRVAGPAFAGPGGWVLYSRFDRTRLRPDEAPLVPARLYLGRLAI
jgi:hypothetical protein